jgi:hypothetical protein
MRRSSARGLPAAALFAVIAACSAASTPGPSTSPAPSSPPALASSEPIATEDAGAKNDPPPPEEAPPLLPRRLAPGSTRGRIACGESRCEAGKEICVILADNRWACVPKEDESKGIGGLFQCDDGTDCPQGKTCCRSFASAAEYVHCTTRDQDCAIEVCEEGGARCPAGQTCQSNVCWPAAKSGPPTPTCGRGKVCGKDKPFCAWANGTGTCVAPQNAPEGASMLRCTQNSDCGAGFHCCTGGAMGTRESFCTLNCDMANTRQYCATDADCPKNAGYALKCKKPEDGDLPPWSKLCTNQ